MTQRPEGYRPCIGVVTHVLNGPISAVVQRLRLEAPSDHGVRAILSTDDPGASLAGLEEADVERISRADLFQLPYPQKCRDEDWQMAGNLDLVFLEFVRRHPSYTHYWFVEYDVHWEGRWSVFFEHFRNTGADVLAATVQQIDEVPHKLDTEAYPRMVVPEGMRWDRSRVIKAFLPICRLSRRALEALDAAYRTGLGGHYEFNVPTVPAQHEMCIEDFGGNGRYVKPENVDRFYFARGSSYSHSPGNFVFRPPQRVLARRNTLWHPVKPDGVPAWHPMRMPGGLLKTGVEFAKPYINLTLVWLWFKMRWHPLPDLDPSDD